MPTPVYHITHIRNLPGIIASGLLCDRLIAERAVPVVGIAHQHIKERRARRRVSIAAGGTLADYAPFMFAPRSPMLYAIRRGQVQGYAEGQAAVIHLVADVERLTDGGARCVFTDGHADMEPSQQYDDLALLPTVIDWGVMRGRYWHNTAQHNDRKRLRQAEFLVHQSVRWAAIHEIGVINRQAKAQVEAVIQQSGSAHRPQVVVRDGWYYP